MTDKPKQTRFYDLEDCSAEDLLKALVSKHNRVLASKIEACTKLTDAKERLEWTRAELNVARRANANLRKENRRLTKECDTVRQRNESLIASLNVVTRERNDMLKQLAPCTTSIFTEIHQCECGNGTIITIDEFRPA